MALWRDLGEELAVHHVDKDQRNNRLDNLLVLTHAEHTRVHRSGQLFIGFCPVCWRLYTYAGNWGVPLFCSTSCHQAAARVTDQKTRWKDPERAASAKRWWVVKSYYAYLRGAAMPPPFREPPEQPEPLPPPAPVT